MTTLWIDATANNEEVLKACEGYTLEKIEIKETGTDYTMFELPYLVTSKSIEYGAENIKKYLQRKQKEYEKLQKEYQEYLRLQQEEEQEEEDG